MVVAITRYFIKTAFQQDPKQSNRIWTHLTNCKTKWLSWNQYLELEQFSNPHISANTHLKWARTPPKETQLKQLFKNIQARVIELKPTSQSAKQVCCLWNQYLELVQHSNAHIFVNTHMKWATQPPKEAHSK